MQWKHDICMQTNNGHAVRGTPVPQDLYAEKWFPFTKELAVMVVRALDGHVRSYPVVETVQKDNICHTVIAPAQA
jgi:phosphoribosylaminoimidazole carboxylase (NCAIR synthetase)